MCRAANLLSNTILSKSYFNLPKTQKSPYCLIEAFKRTTSSETYDASLQALIPLDQNQSAHTLR